MSIKIYHNPRCSKSRQTLQLLQDQGFAPEVIEYLKQPPSAEELGDIIRQLGMTPRQLLRTQEEAYTDEGLADMTLSDADIIAAMLRSPKLIERPIVVAHDKAAIGRPPEAVLTIL